MRQPSRAVVRTTVSFVISSSSFAQTATLVALAKAAVRRRSSKEK